MAKSTSTKKNKKISIELWIAIGNLFLTAIVGIGIAVFLQVRDQSFQMDLQKENEEFQQQLVELQSQINNQSQFANLTVNSMCNFSHTPCDGKYGFEIINDGPATAENISIVVYNFDTYWPWISEVQDISQFFDSVPNMALNVESETARIENIYSVRGNNRITFSIGKVPPNSKIPFEFRRPGVPIKSISYPVDLVITYPAEYEQIWQNNKYNLLSVFFENIAGSKIAWFKGDIACENCSRIDGNIEFQIPAFSYIEIEQEETPALNRDQYSTRIQIIVHYLFPESLEINIPIFPVTSVKLVNNGNNDFLLSYDNK